MSTQSASDYGAFILRLSLGVMFVAHGLLKVIVFTLPGTAQFFDSVGLPGILAYPVAFAEIGGGLLLIVGLATRSVSFTLLPVLLGALYVHAGNGWLFTSANGGWEYPAFLSAATLAQALIGPGAFAIRLQRKTARSENRLAAQHS